jgi:MmyB-like transcription regulator ligand binding domain/Helix-turn-helix domain
MSRQQPHGPAASKPPPRRAAALRRLLDDARNSRRIADAWQAAHEARIIDLPYSTFDSPWKKRSPTVTQNDMALLLGISERQYGDYERGDASIRAHRLGAIATVLGLTGHQRDRLFTLALPPPAHPLTPATRRALGRFWPAFTADPPYPTYCVTMGWRLLEANKAFWDAWSELTRDLNSPQASIYYLAFHSQARRRMLNWETDWGSRLFSQIWIAYQAYPDNPDLAAAVAEVAGTPQWRNIWLRRNERTAITHPDQDRRWLDHPTWGRAEVTIGSVLPETMVHDMLAGDIRVPPLRIVQMRPISALAPPNGFTNNTS